MSGLRPRSSLKYRFLYAVFIFPRFSSHPSSASARLKSRTAGNSVASGFSLFLTCTHREASI